MHFLPDVYVACEACGGKRYQAARRSSIRYMGHSVGEILGMTVEEAARFFEATRRSLEALRTLCDVGLGYIHARAAGDHALGR